MYIVLFYVREGVAMNSISALTVGKLIEAPMDNNNEKITLDKYKEDLE